MTDDCTNRKFRIGNSCLANSPGTEPEIQAHLRIRRMRADQTDAARRIIRQNLFSSGSSEDKYTRLNGMNFDGCKPVNNLRRSVTWQTFAPEIIFFTGCQPKFV
jgi:hypothetical protein